MEVGSLNYTEDGYIDYTFISLEEPPTFSAYGFEIYDYKGTIRFINRNPGIAIGAGVIYLMVIFGLQYWMKGRRPFDLIWEMAVWNMGLGILSIVGFLRIAPEFIYLFTVKYGLWNSLCVRQGGNFPMAFWTWIFLLSKYVELGDTVFLVLRKRPVTFLQWYHHLVTMLVSWLTTPFVEPIGRYYIVMNYLVHSLMYPYFSFMAMGVRVPRRVANVITTFQLSQMLIALLVNCLSAYLYYSGTGCTRHPTSIKMFFCVYGSFVVLFGNLFFKIVVQKRSQEAKKTA